MAASSPDMVAVVLNVIPQKLHDWSRLNRLIPHPGKTNYTILMRGQFVGPLQAVSLGNSVVTQVKYTRCLGVKIGSDLTWKHHVKELIKSFSLKLNLLRSLYFLPTTARADFYFKVILPSVTYGLDWYTPSDQVLAQNKWPTVEDLYEYRLLMIAHNCFYNFFSVPIMKLFTKYECNYNLRRKLTLFSKGKVRKNVA